MPLAPQAFAQETAPETTTEIATTTTVVETENTPENSEPAPSLLADTPQEDGKEVQATSELLTKGLWTLMNAGETKEVQVATDFKNTEGLQVSVDASSVPEGWNVEVINTSTLKVTPDKDERLRKVVLKVSATHVDGRTNTADVEINVIPVTEEGHRKTVAELDRLTKAGELDEFFNENTMLRDSVDPNDMPPEESFAETQDQNSDNENKDGRSELAATGASVLALGAVGSLISIIGASVFLRRRK